MSERDSSHFALGFLLGAIAGVAIGFLYAPKSGRETREMLREKGSEVKEKAKEIAAKARDKVRERLAGKEEEA